MIYKIGPTTDAYLEKIITESMRDLNSFYEINWVRNIPKIIVVPDRNTIDLLKGEKTESWVEGWSEGRTIYILDRNNLEKESSHVYDPIVYAHFLKHELSHSFFNILSDNRHKPVWLCEGAAIYTSGQNDEKTKPKEFKNFLDFVDTGGRGVYNESGFAIQLLVERFGKEKLLKLIKQLGSTASFDELFEHIYGFQPKYAEFNNLYLTSHE